MRGFLRLLVERLARMHVHIDTDEVDELARPIGHQHRASCPRRDPRPTRAPRRERGCNRSGVDEHAVDDEAGRVVAADGMLAELLARMRTRFSKASSPLSSARNDLDERHQRRRVEEVQCPRLARASMSQLRSRSPREPTYSWRAPLGTAHALELGEEVLLRCDFLDDGLDHEVQSAKSSRSVVSDSRPRAASRASWSSCPFSTCG